MKKTGLLLSAVTVGLLTSAVAQDYELSGVAGMIKPEGNLGLYVQRAVGGELQFNNIFDSIKPELMVLVSPRAEYKVVDKRSTFSRFMLNGVHEYSAWGTVIPFMKAGLGYEDVRREYNGNEDSVLADAGLGFKFPLTETFALKLEGLYMLNYNDERWDNYVAGLAGLTIAFGGGEAPQTAVAPEPEPEPVAEPEPAPAPVIADMDKDGVADQLDKCPNTPEDATVDARGCQLDTDGDGVVDGADECPSTPAGASVDDRGCQPDGDNDGVPDTIDLCQGTPEGEPVDAVGCELDSDNDGVDDRMDKCPETPKGFKVDADGCPLVKTMKIHFETGSSTIAADSVAEVADFATFLNESPAYGLKILGHTDSVGSEKNNMKLSQARADSVKKMLVANGVAADRIKAEGKGESQPVADNATKEGRAANRRIEVWLLK